MKIDLQVLLVMAEEAENYASGMVKIFKDSIGKGLTQHKIQQNIVDILAQAKLIKNEKTYFEIINNPTPCEFAISVYMILHNLTPENPNLIKYYMQIVKTMEGVAPDFVGEKERQALADPNLRKVLVLNG